MWYRCVQVLAAVTVSRVWTASVRGQPTPNIRFSNSRRNSTSTDTWRGAGASRSLTYSASPSDRSRSGSRTAAWSGKRRTNCPTPNPSSPSCHRRPMTTPNPRPPTVLAPGTPSRRRIAVTTVRSRTTTTQPKVARQWRHPTCRHTNGSIQTRKIWCPDLVNRHRDVRRLFFACIYLDIDRV